MHFLQAGSSVHKVNETLQNNLLELLSRRACNKRAGERLRTWLSSVGFSWRAATRAQTLNGGHCFASAVLEPSCYTMDGWAESAWDDCFGHKSGRELLPDSAVTVSRERHFIHWLGRQWLPSVTHLDDDGGRATVLNKGTPSTICCKFLVVYYSGVHPISQNIACIW